MTPSTHYMEGWVGSSTGLGTVEKSLKHIGNRTRIPLLCTQYSLYLLSYRGCISLAL
jgi:hypothetical protein